MRPVAGSRGICRALVLSRIYFLALPGIAYTLWSLKARCVIWTAAPRRSARARTPRVKLTGNCRWFAPSLVPRHPTTGENRAASAALPHTGYHYPRPMLINAYHCISTLIFSPCSYLSWSAFYAAPHLTTSEKPRKPLWSAATPHKPHRYLLRRTLINAYHFIAPGDVPFLHLHAVTQRHQHSFTVSVPIINRRLIV